MKWSLIFAVFICLWLFLYSVTFLHKSGSVVSERVCLSLFLFSYPQHGHGIRSSTSQPRQPPMVEGKKDEGAGDPVKILLEDALEKQRNAMMDKFSRILQRLPTGGTSTSRKIQHQVQQNFPPFPPWRNLMQWRPLLPKEGGMIQVDIGGHPPNPFGPVASILSVF